MLPLFVPVGSVAKYTRERARAREFCIDKGVEPAAKTQLAAKGVFRTLRDIYTHVIPVS